MKTCIGAHAFPAGIRAFLWWRVTFHVKKVLGSPKNKNTKVVIRLPEHAPASTLGTSMSNVYPECWGRVFPCLGRGKRGLYLGLDSMYFSSLNKNNIFYLYQSQKIIADFGALPRTRTSFPRHSNSGPGLPRIRFGGPGSRRGNRTLGLSEGQSGWR